MLTAATTTHPIQPLRAGRAIRALLQNPEDTAEAFNLIDALSGHAPTWAAERLGDDPSGRRLLAERPAIVPLLVDRSALRRTPEGSLAHAYVDFVESEGITAAGLEAAAADSGLQAADLPDEVRFFHSRMRDTHDLWHAATGYRGDVLGEAALLAFSIPQTRNLGIGLIAAAGVLRAPSRETRAVILDGLRRGIHAAWLPAVYWEALLPLPLHEVRRQLRLEPPAVYTPVRPAEYRARGL